MKKKNDASVASEREREKKIKFVMKKMMKMKNYVDEL